MNYYWTNFHSHCDLCDGRDSMRAFVEKAIELKLDSYGISSHSPLPFTTRWNMLLENLQEYRRQFEVLKGEYQNQINLFLGLEVDYIKGIIDTRTPYIQNAQLDYLIGSVHYLGKLENGESWTVDGPWENFNKGVNDFFNGDYKLAALFYFNTCKEMIEIGGFDILGHFDKIAVQNQEHLCFLDNEPWYIDEIKEVLRLCKGKDIIIEINTKSIERKGIYFPSQNIWTAVLQMGNKIMVNSDCHEPNLITVGFNQVYEQLYLLGFREVVVRKGADWETKAISKKGITR